MIKEYKTVSTVFGLPNWVIKCVSSLVGKIKPRLGYVMSKS